jgi:hypothetical protein
MDMDWYAAQAGLEEKAYKQGYKSTTNTTFSFWALTDAGKGPP